jgi:hypothetical protein
MASVTYSPTNQVEELKGKREKGKEVTNNNDKRLSTFIQYTLDR